MNEYSRDQELHPLTSQALLVPWETKAVAYDGTLSLVAQDNFHHHWPRLSLAHEAYPQNSPTELGSSLSTVIAESSQVEPGHCSLPGISDPTHWVV